LFRTPYTTFPQNGLFAFFPYLFLGKLAAPPARHEQLIVLFHIFRIAAGILVILATYDFLSIFLKRESNRRIGTALAAVGGGLGWILIFAGQTTWLGSLPLEVYSPETFGFLELYALPHLALARACLLWGLCCYLGANVDFAGPLHRRNAVLGGVLFFLAGLLQPLTALVGWVILAAHLSVTACFQFYRRRMIGTASWASWRNLLWNALGLMAISSPIILYTVYASVTDPFLRAWTGQNIILSPHPLHYLFAYGLLLPFAASGVIHLLRSDPPKGLFLAGWILIFPFLAYAPVNIQRRLPEGIWVAWIALALASFEIVKTVRKDRLRYLFALSGPATLIVFLTGCLASLNPQFPLFRPVAEIAAFEYLEEQAPPGAVVLAAYDTANALPAWASVRVVVGHGPESIHKPELLGKVDQFYGGDSPDSECKPFLKEHAIQYVFWGPFERRIGDWDPGQAGYLTHVYDRDGYAIFQVNREEFP
jgi:hypothetical protein